MSRLKCPECSQRSCCFHVTEVECYQCGENFSAEDIDEHAMEASEEGMPIECPYCERPTIELIVTGETCSECDYYHPLPSTYLSGLHTDKYDDPGEEEKDVEPQNHPEVLIGSNFCVAYNRYPRRSNFE